MSEMVERVADALYRGGPVLTPRDSVIYARIAIAAMREPTAAMLLCARGAGWHGGIEGLSDSEEASGKILWQDMIDAALAGNDSATGSCESGSAQRSTEPQTIIPPTHHDDRPGL